MTLMLWIALALTVGLLGYLFYALLFPGRLS